MKKIKTVEEFLKELPKLKERECIEWDESSINNKSIK